ncbi:MAG: neutral zinc metallopeptidase, partial [Betaproteobacteria bacterium]|nr:neutral zinc metallopeptidase [Betaproteobacteria bacterium]
MTKSNKCVQLILLPFFLVAFGNAHAISELEEKVSAVFLLVKSFKANNSNAPKYKIFNERINSKCAVISASSFCPADHTIYLEKRQLEKFYEISPVALDLIIAHEYAHAMQSVYGFSRKYTVLNELQADCLAGVYLE